MSLNGCQWLVVTWRGENEAVTFGNMNVLNSAFIDFGKSEIYGPEK